MLGICSVRFTVRVAIASRNTGSSSRSDQSAFSKLQSTACRAEDAG